MSSNDKIKCLFNWCVIRTKNYQNIKITNFTTSWRNGLGFCAILHQYGPEFIDYDSLNSEDVQKNCQLAFDVGENFFGIPALLDASDMVLLKVPDRLSILTYLFQYYSTLSTKETKMHITVVSPLSPIDNIPDYATKELNANQSTESDLQQKQRNDPTCEICLVKIYFLEKLAVNGKSYHRTCYRQTQLSNLQKRNLTLERNNRNNDPKLEPENNIKHPRLNSSELKNPVPLLIDNGNTESNSKSFTDDKVSKPDEDTKKDNARSTIGGMLSRMKSSPLLVKDTNAPKSTCSVEDDSSKISARANVSSTLSGLISPTRPLKGTNKEDATIKKDNISTLTEQRTIIMSIDDESKGNVSSNVNEIRPGAKSFYNTTKDTNKSDVKTKEDTSKRDIKLPSSGQSTTIASKDDQKKGVDEIRLGAKSLVNTMMDMNKSDVEMKEGNSKRDIKLPSSGQSTTIALKYEQKKGVDEIRLDAKSWMNTTKDTNKSDVEMKEDTFKRDIKLPSSGGCITIAPKNDQKKGVDEIKPVAKSLVNTTKDPNKYDVEMKEDTSKRDSKLPSSGQSTTNASKDDEKKDVDEIRPVAKSLVNTTKDTNKTDVAMMEDTSKRDITLTSSEQSTTITSLDDPSRRSFNVVNTSLSKIETIKSSNDIKRDKSNLSTKDSAIQDVSLHRDISMLNLNIISSSLSLEMEKPNVMVQEMKEDNNVSADAKQVPLGDNEMKKEFARTKIKSALSFVNRNDSLRDKDTKKENSLVENKNKEEKSKLPLVLSPEMEINKDESNKGTILSKNESVEKGTFSIFPKTETHKPDLQSKNEDHNSNVSGSLPLNNKGTFSSNVVLESELEQIKKDSNLSIKSTFPTPKSRGAFCKEEQKPDIISKIEEKKPDISIGETVVQKEGGNRNIPERPTIKPRQHGSIRSEGQSLSNGEKSTKLDDTTKDINQNKDINNNALNTEYPAPEDHRSSSTKQILVRDYDQSSSEYCLFSAIKKLQPSCKEEETKKPVAQKRTKVPMEKSKSSDALNEDIVPYDDHLKRLTPQRPPPPKSSSSYKRDPRPAPPRPLPEKRQVRGNKFIPYESLYTQLKEVDEEQSVIEKKSRPVEQALKKLKEKDEGYDPLLQEWLEIVEKKNALFKKEHDLHEILKQQELEDRHTDLEYEYRILFGIQESLKTAKEKAREDELLKQIILTVNARSKLIEDQDDAQDNSSIQEMPKKKSIVQKILNAKTFRSSSLAGPLMPWKLSKSEKKSAKKPVFYDD